MFCLLMAIPATPALASSAAKNSCTISLGPGGGMACSASSRDFRLKAQSNVMGCQSGKAQHGRDLR